MVIRMRLIDADELFELVGNIKPNNNQQYADIGMFMNMITNSTTVEMPNTLRSMMVQEVKRNEIPRLHDSRNVSESTD